MKRNDLIKELIKVGLSESTLVNFSDQQIFTLSKRMLGEQGLNTPKVLNVPKEDRTSIDQAMKTKQKFVTYEEETKEEVKGNQKKLDKNHNGKIDAQDFKILRGQKKKVVSQEKPSKGLNKEKKVKESATKSPKKVASAATWKGQKNESVEAKKWVFELLDKHYHPVTTKKEIVDTIRKKLNEQPAPAIAPTKPVTKPTTKPTVIPKPKKPTEPSPGPLPEPKNMDSGMPDFLSFDSLKSASAPAVAPTKPVTKPTTKPTTIPKPKKPTEPSPGPLGEPKNMR